MSHKSPRFTRFFLKFEDRIERRYMLSSVANDLPGFRTLYLSLVLINPFLFILDALRFNDPTASIFTRSLSELVLIATYAISRQLKVTDINKFQRLIVSSTLILYAMFLSSDYLIRVGYYELFIPNATSILLFINASFVGLRFRHSVILNSLTVFIYSLYASLFSFRPIHLNQLAYLIVFFVLVTIISYIMERKNRKLFLKREVIAEQKKLIEQKNDELEKQSEMKTSLMSILTHDIKSPLSSLQELLKLRSGNILSEEATIDHFNQIGNSFEKTNELIDNMILWVKTQMEGFGSKKEAFSVKEAIDQVIAHCKAASEKKNVQIILENNSDQTLTSDKEMFSIVLRNLVVNAIKFSYENSTISIRIIRKATTLEITVVDAGIGISNEKKADVFSQNYTSPGTSDEKGTGLGLPLSHNLMKVLGGDLTFISEEDEGSSFSMVFYQ